MRLIVTRPEEDALATARALELRGHSPILAPLLDIALLPGVGIPHDDYRAVLVTSANGARALAGNPAIGHLSNRLAVAVGPASAEAARAAGFRDVAAAEGDLVSLVNWVKDNLPPGGSPLLYASGAVTAGDVVRELGALGYGVRRVVLYEAKPVASLPRTAAMALAGGTADGVLLYSPRTASVWADLVLGAGLQEQAARLRHYCLSSNVASAVGRAFGDACPIAVAESPDEPALLRLMDGNA